MSIFNKQQFRRVKKNKFDLSHEKKLTMNMGDLVPILCEEVLPGDSFRVNSECLIRFAPLLAPVMHRVNVFTHYFFVPNRLVWDEWKDFITGGKDGLAAPLHPRASWPLDTLTGKGSLGDYLCNLPDWELADGPATSNTFVNALPFRAYQLIYNEFYRDQTLTPEVDFSHGSGDSDGIDLNKILQLRKRSWEKDYFTTCLPFAQRGGAVSAPGDVGYLPNSRVFNADDTAADVNTLVGTNGADGSKMMVGKTDAITGGELGRIENIENVSTQISELRKAFRLQEWLERNARAGGRYVEQLLAHWGVISSDARLQRPEYLGGAKTPVVMSEVLSNFQFSGDAEGQPQGHMAGHGISVGSYNGFKRRFEEHGFVIGIMSVIPRTAYQNQIMRSWTREDKFDYAWPEFANIGEQAVLNKEVYFNPLEPDPLAQNNTFGYQSRYAEYKYRPTTVHGDFRGNLAYWHDGRIFAAPPVLNQSFVESDPSQRIFAVTDPAVHKLYVQIHHAFSAIRPLPYFSNPGL